jgi:hypothetical protein
VNKARGDLSEHYARDYTERDPDGQITLKGIQTTGGASVSVVSMNLLSNLSRFID